VPFEMPTNERPYSVVQGDCREWLPALADGIDAVVTDPPYGINFDFAKRRNGRKSGLKWGRGGAPNIQRDWKRIVADDRPFDPAPLLQYPRVILWGANHYAASLPNADRWLVWDKRDGTTSDDHSDCELAWTNLGGPVRMFSHLWRGICRAGEENVTNGAKLHPAQKPLALMRWCLSFLPEGGTVLDPYMGSGTTGVACLQTGRRFIGFEIDPGHYDTARRRLAQSWGEPVTDAAGHTLSTNLFAGVADTEGA
jgi:site-specific DNA-methyltransferase (adenine-specific)